MPKRGLPETLRMRHDAHYVETLASSAATPVGRMVPIDLVDPNPDQPRQAMGDLSELIASVAEKGIIEPLVVRQRGPRDQRVAGERRDHAAVQSGRIGPDTPSNAPSASSQTRSRAGSTGPGMMARPLGIGLKPDLP